jgi:FkbM family methyltransferase
MRLNMSEYIERSIFLGSFERLTRRVILDSLTPDSVFLDIGANVGYYSLIVSAKLGRSGRVLAFEPNPRMVARLRANIELSSAPGIEIFALALSSDSGRATLFSPGSGNQGEASLVNQGWGECEQYSVPVSRLDDCLPPDLERVDLIKIDVEGAEALVFEGAKRTIIRFAPAILLEINERAARSFGFGPLDATKRILGFRPDYGIYRITSHSVTRSSLADLSTGAASNCNLLLTPVR